MHLRRPKKPLAGVLRRLIGSGVIPSVSGGIYNGQRKSPALGAGRFLVACLVVFCFLV